MPQFLGATILDFNIRGSFGQGNDIALDVSLAECEFTNPTFSPPVIGSPVQFTFENFNWYGITDIYKEDRSSGGNPTYSVSVTNGQFILGGVELILNDYYGSVNSVPNLINIFGYMENAGGFGYSGVNSAGMSWYDIATTLTTVCNNISGTSYGSPITYKGYKYQIDLSNLPSIPTYYRINNSSINLMDFITEVCSAGGYDFFIRLNAPTSGEISAGWSGTFEIITMSRITEPTPGMVDSYIDSASCVTSKNYGQEVRKDVHSKFVVGANLERMYFNYYQDTSGDNPISGLITADEYSNDTVLPFYGVDKDNNLIVGYTPSGEPNEYYFNIDVSDIDLPVATGTYLSCTSELRAAKKGRDSWQKYICGRDCNEYIVEPTGTYYSTFKVDFDTGNQFDTGSGNYLLPKYGYITSHALKGEAYANAKYPTVGDRSIRYRHNLNENAYFRRATELKISDGWRIAYPRMLEEDLYAKSTTDSTMLRIYEDFKKSFGIINQEWAALEGDNVVRASRKEDDSLGNFNDNKTDQLFKRIKGIADTYYNKKFMVSIPFTLGTYEPESFNIRMSQQVINEGFIDESAWATAYNAGLIPDISGINTLMSQDNKFYPFVKYENCVTLASGTGAVESMLYDFSEVGPEDKIFNTPVIGTGGEQIYDCWVKCRVDNKIYFHDTQTLYIPRAVIEVPGSVKLNRSVDYPSYAQALFDSHAQATGVGGVFFGDATVTASFLKSSFDRVGGDDALMHNGEPIVTPDLLAIPLKSQLLCYGPWYAIGASGKVTYERNEELNPWNYGGFTAMDLAGWARVTDGITNQTYSEAGSITAIGAPTFNFGDVLISGGPYITDISCSFGSNGVTTTYNFQAWSTHKNLSKLNGYGIERNKRLSNTLREIKSNYREGLKNGRFKNAGDFYNKVSNRFINLSDYARKERSSTSHKMLSAEINGGSPLVVTQPIYNAGAQAYTDYEDKAFMSMDGLFSPFSTVAKSGWPSYVIPSSTGVNVTTMNPFTSGNNITALAYGSGLHERGLLRGTGEIPYSGGDVVPYRAIGLRLPIIGVGWGFDLSGNPVPSGTGENGFRDDYLSNAEYHKAGPIDLRWDEDSGMWTTLGNGGTTSGSATSCGCGCICADGYDLVLPDGTQTTNIMAWVPPGGLEIDVANGHISLPALNTIDALPNLSTYYPLTYVTGSSGTWSLVLDDYLYARYSDTISSGDGSTILGASATGVGVEKTGSVYFIRETGSQMALVVNIAGTIPAT